jgi:hypothetical protein
LQGQKQSICDGVADLSHMTGFTVVPVWPGRADPVAAPERPGSSARRLRRVIERDELVYHLEDTAHIPADQS